MKKKLPIIAVLLLVAIGGAYKVTRKPAKPAPKPHVNSLVYMLPKDFTIYLAGGRYVKLGLGLEVSKKDPESLTPKTGESAATTPKGYGVMPEEALVREVVTEDLTGLDDQQFLDSSSRNALKAKLTKDISDSADVHLDGVLFSDVAIQ